ncbi:DUF2288 domain-containing protein [Candidatus Sororendozoicomonas aggregata]|uniref:DUF2288 domain-containing protein n=1 Tax=Candidatus Sororendozoicomonas aggregata TaxID=3073239 RepID=UPI002ED384FF
MRQDDRDTLKAKINLETAQISWEALQRHFAAGRLVSVSPKLDLVDVGFQFSQDNKTQLEAWLANGDVQPVSDQQAMTWCNKKASLWSLVIKPWVLVQDKT